KRQKKIQIIDVQHQRKQGSSISAMKKNHGATVKSRIECRFRQLKKFHNTQRPKMTAAAF
ncbi:hypothetical protein MKX01_016579, partial [Papaver californicum]